MISINQLIQLRAYIGFLGEKDQYNWWPSSFYSATSAAFLSPVFSRTQNLARLSGVARAASRVHDEFIGVGAVYHLFRLPERLEQRIVTSIQQEPDAIKAPADKDEALIWLKGHSDVAPSPAIGPVHVGNVEQLQNGTSWRVALGYYLAAFDTGERSYPYFRDAIE